MSEPAAPEGGSPAGARVDETPKYEGSRFPWWLVLIWVAYIWWAVSYFIEWNVPEYGEWFSNPGEVVHRPMHK